MSHMKYSFVLPAYKATYLKDAIDSILSQTYSQFELIIVNDASPEDIDSIINSCQDDRIKYYKNKNNKGGIDLVSQWNHCLGFADSEYVILASDDDVYVSTYLEKMNALVEKYPNVNVFRPRVQHVDGQGEVSGVEAVMPEYVSEIEYHYYWLKNWIFRGIPFYVFKLSALRDAGCFHNYPLAWCCDDDIVMRLICQGMATSSETLFSFRLSGISITSRKSSVKDVEQKSQAIYMYFLELKGRLEQIRNSQIPKSDQWLLASLQVEVNINWINNEISNLCYKLSYPELLNMTTHLLSFDTISCWELIKIHFRYIKHTLFNRSR